MEKLNLRLFCDDVDNKIDGKIVASEVEDDYKIFYCLLSLFSIFYLFMEFYCYG